MASLIEMANQARKGGLVQEHWTSVGRRLAAATASRPKAERSACVRQAASELGLSPHSVRRFVVLIDLLDSLEVRSEDFEQFPIGVTEIISRIADRDRTVAVTLSKDVIEKGVKYQDAVDVLRALHDPKILPQYRDTDEFKRVASVVARCAFPKAQLDEIRFGGGHHYSFCHIHSSWYYKGDLLAFISEADPVYSSSRGLRRIMRDVLIAAVEFDIVVVEFISKKTQKSFSEAIELIRDDIKNRIINSGIVDKKAAEEMMLRKQDGSR